MINIIGGTIIRTIMKRDLEKGKLLKIDLTTLINLSYNSHL